MPSYRHIWKIAYPIMLSLLAQNVINVIDTAFLGRVGETELGAAAIAGIFYVILYMVGFGFSIGAQIIMARRNGEGNKQAIGEIFDHSLYFLLMLGIILFLVFGFAGRKILHVLISSPEVFEAASTYLHYRMWGIFFAFFNVMARAFYVAITRTRILSASAAIMALANVILDYLLIFGHFGFPKMGIAGAALASAISEGLASLFFLLLILQQHDRPIFGLFAFPSVSLRTILKILNVSFYVMIQFVASLSAWFLFFIIIEKMGERNLAISNIVRSIYMVLMIPVWAFSSTTNSLVSNIIGQKKISLVLPLIRKITLITIVFVMIMLLIPLLFGSAIIRVYTPDSELIADTLPSLYVILGAMILFAGVQNLFSGVSGTGDTKAALIIESITLAIYLVAAWLIGIYWKQPLTIVWLCEYVYFILLGSISFIYLYSARWKRKGIGV